MDFNQNIESLLKVQQDGFISCTGKNYLSKIRLNHQVEGIKLFGDIIDTFGIRSAKSQGLKQVITSLDRFIHTDQRIYIKIYQNKVLGFVKVGQKNLFYRDHIGTIKQLKPTCILDIYVHESCQRNGIGKEIFQKFLKAQSKTAEKLAYDKPSQKLIGFLKKHYQLSKFIPQNNNYVIFDRYFDKNVDKYVQKPKTVQNIKRLKNQEPQDSIEVLKKQMNTKMIMQPINYQNPIVKQKQQSFKGFSYPWGVKNQKMAFRTTSGTYGSHYINNNFHK